MSYVVIARRWRPQKFEEIIGQDHVSKTLANAITNKRIAHSYIFTGPRGVGKTTSARILAKALNCEKGPTANPCNACPSCESITKGNSLDVLEIDGASNRGIDEIRNLRENIRFTPTMGKYKVYIIDEVHMLTKEAFNALLKTLEEPPEHALFIFATTEIHKVPATILSRCQRFDFRRIPLKTIMAHLQNICTTDKIEADEDALLQIAKKADGSMRDAQSVLDQIISYSGDTIHFEDVSKALGVIHQDIYFKITEQVRQQQIKELILAARDVFDSGYDINEFLLGLEEHFRNLLVVRSTGSTDFLDVSENYIPRYQESAQQFSENDLIGYLQTIAETMQLVRNSQQPNLKFELGLIKMAKMPSAVQIEEILEQLQLLKKKSPPLTEAVSEPDSAQPAYPSEPAALTQEQLQQARPAILKEIDQKKPTLSPMLEKCSFVVSGPEQITLKLGTLNPLQQTLLEGSKSEILECFEAVLGMELHIKFLYDLEAPEVIQKNQAQKTAQSKEKIVQKVRTEGGEVISRLVDEFGLEAL